MSTLSTSFPDIELFYNVCYIVCGAVVEGGRVLLVQEAKPSCRGKWYLPAGRMEKNETIVVRAWHNPTVCTCLMVDSLAAVTTGGSEERGEGGIWIGL